MFGNILLYPKIQDWQKHDGQTLSHSSVSNTIHYLSIWLYSDRSAHVSRGLIDMYVYQLLNNKFLQKLKQGVIQM